MQKYVQALVCEAMEEKIMKLSIGDNIRDYRKKNDLTQEEFALRLGVSYQSVSRWENGNFYPDIELIPAIAETLGVTVDTLFGIPEDQKEKSAEAAFDNLRRECIKSDYDADKIVELIRDIRRNYMDSASAWRPWCEGNGRTLSDPKILPEVRLLADDYFKRHPMDPQAIRTMAGVEDEEHLQSFLDKYTTPWDCSSRALLFDRYQLRGNAEKFDEERRYQLFKAFDKLLCPRYFLKFNAPQETRDAADIFMANMLDVIRSDAKDDSPDMWVDDRIDKGIILAKILVSKNKIDEAIDKLESVVKLLERTMRITDKIILPTSCRFLEGMEWSACEAWHNLDNNPDSPKERMIYIENTISDMCICYCIYPSRYYSLLQDKEFDAIRNRTDFTKLCDRVKALIVTK